MAVDESDQGVGMSEPVLNERKGRSDDRDGARDRQRNYRQIPTGTREDIATCACESRPGKKALETTSELASVNQTRHERKIAFGDLDVPSRDDKTSRRLIDHQQAMGYDLREHVEDEHEYNRPQVERNRRHQDPEGELALGGRRNRSTDANDNMGIGNGPSRFEGSSRRTQLQERVDELEKKNKRLKNKLEASEEEREGLNQKLEKERREHKQLRMRYESKAAEYQQNECMLASNRQLLEQRTQELQSAQSYLNPARVYSGAELIHLAESVNTEILNAAASIVDNVEISPPDTAGVIDLNIPYVSDELRSILGDDVLGALEIARSKRLEDTLRAILQSAMQAVIVFHLAHMVNAWSLGDHTQSNLLQGIYREIRKNVALPTVAGRWRVMTKAQSKYTSYAATQRTVGQFLTQTIVSVLSLVDSNLGQRLDGDRPLRETIDGRIGDLLLCAGQLDRALGETVDEDWGVFFAFPGEGFSPDSMEDTYAAPNARACPVPTPAAVFCTTDLGLMKATWDKSSGSEHRQVMLKAKVVLQKTIAEGLNSEGTKNTQTR
ncbi:hypothetical protein V5O48_008366 [Marasmius crinis-equi]|uniref:Uncharacterized protein n=1 Tax=Marasmius crinis-equi TaxID=585013 RepID=A0ABR3FE87_9AGAR